VTALLLAHRGTGTQRRENTLEAFEWAVSHGATWLETDVRATLDGELVCLHDETVDRTTSGRGPVTRLTLTQARRLGVPSLDEAVAGFPGVSWNIDIKQRRPPVAARLVQFLAERSLDDHVRVASFSGRTIREFRRLTAGRVRTAAATDEVVAAWLASRRRRPLGHPRYDALQVPVRQGVTVIDPAFVAAAHTAGVAVHAWTIDDPDEAERLWAMGVDGIITNRVDRLAA
jgi:glycerophosphoryl diester phosphodiesterase